jgi:hypothetical protein
MPIPQISDFIEARMMHQPSLKSNLNPHKKE